MSHSRVKPFGWSVLDKLYPAEATQLDVNIANSVDKVLGDIVTGPLAINGGLTIGGPGAVVVPGVSFTQDNFTTYAPSKTVVRTFSLPANLIAFSANSPLMKAASRSIRGAAALSGIPEACYVQIPNLIDGATIDSVNFFYRVPNLRTQVPSAVAKFAVLREAINPIYGAPFEYLSTTNFVFATGGTLAAHKAATSAFYLCNANNIINTSVYNYYALITDEILNSSESFIVGTDYNAMVVTYSNITNSGQV